MKRQAGHSTSLKLSGGKLCMYVCMYACMHACIYIQGVLLPDQQTLWGDSRHEKNIIEWETMGHKRLL